MTLPLTQPSDSSQDSRDVFRKIQKRLSIKTRLKEGPPLVVPIEMWATLPKGECIGSWENQLSMEGRGDGITRLIRLSHILLG